VEIFSMQTDGSENKITQKTQVIEENLAQVKERFNEFRSIYLNAGGSEQETFGTFDKYYQKIKDHTENILSLLRQGEIGQVKTMYFTQYIPDFDVMRNAMDQLTDVISMESQEEFDNSIHQANNINIGSFIFFTVILVLLISSGWFLTTSIMDLLGVEPFEAALIATNLAKGNIRFELRKKKSKGLYENMKYMMKNLSRIIIETLTTSNHIAKAATEFSIGSQQISDWANQQAASAEEIATSMEQMTASIEQNALNAKETASISIKAAEDISIVNNSVKQTIGSMKDVIKRIKIIEEIVRQTNILALNAAVEAARAGENGKGFAIIATEIRKLAERSKGAAEEIGKLSQTSIKVADNSDQLLNVVVPEIRKTAELVGNIMSSSNEQSESSRQISHAIQQLNEIVQHNAAASEEMASSSQELNAQAEGLKESMSFFKT